MGGNSVEYLTKRLRDGGELELLGAVERGELSTYAAAEAAGIVKRRPVTGGGSENQARRRRWAVHLATGRAGAICPCFGADHAGPRGRHCRMGGSTEAITP
jgi:hypothetical protein